MKNLKISKILFCPVLAVQSRLYQVTCLSRVFAGHFWRFVREWKVQSRGLLRDFRGSARNSLAGRPSSREKHLEKFFQIFVLECFSGLIWRLFGDSFQSRKSRVLEIQGQFLNFFVFPRSFCDYSLSLSTALTHSHRASIFDLHCYFFSAQNHQVTGMVFLS